MDSIVRPCHRNGAGGVCDKAAGQIPGSGIEADRSDYLSGSDCRSGGGGLRREPHPCNARFAYRSDGGAPVRIAISILPAMPTSGLAVRLVAQADTRRWLWPLQE